MKSTKFSIAQLFFSSPGKRIKGIAVASFILNVILLLLACAVGAIVAIIALIEEPMIAICILVGILLSPIILLYIWIYFVFIYGFGVLIDSCTYLPRIAHSMGIEIDAEEIIPLIPQKKDKSKQKDLDEAKSEDAKENTEEDNTEEHQEPPQPEQVIIIAKKYKSKRGKAQPALTVLENALSYHSYEGITDYLQTFSDEPDIAAILATPERNIRQAIRSLMNQLIEEASTPTETV